MAGHLLRTHARLGTTEHESTAPYGTVRSPRRTKVFRSRQVRLLAGLICLAALLCGCDATYQVMYENHSDGIVAFTLLNSSASVPPCTMVHEPAVPGGGYIGSRGPEYRVEDANRKLLLSSDAVVSQRAPLKGRYNRWLIARYSAQDTSLCPLPVQDSYRVAVTNGTTEALNVEIAKTDLNINPEQTVTGVPVKGSYMNAALPKVPSGWLRDRIGRDLTCSFTIPPIAMGDIPVVQYKIEYYKSRGW